MDKQPSKWWFGVALAAGLGLSGYFVYRLWKRHSDAEKRSQQPSDISVPVVQIKATKAPRK